MASRRKVAGAIRSLVYARGLQLECESETILWKEERSRIRPIQMDNFRGLFNIRRMDRVLHIWIRELCRVTKRINKRMDEAVLRWFGYAESMEKDRLGKRISVRKCAGFHSVCRLQKRWIDRSNGGGL